MRANTIENYILFELDSVEYRIKITRVRKSIYRLFFNKSGISDGSFATGIPAAWNAAIFSAAVPPPLEMIAPAWPICFPEGACLPAELCDS